MTSQWCIRMSNREDLATVSRVVVKVGSALLTNGGRGLAVDKIADYCQQIVRLRESGKQVVLVSSGAVAEGCTRLGWTQRPDTVHELQAAAAVGQMGLVQAYESEFQKFGCHTAMVMLTHDDLADRQRYLNARATLSQLCELGVIPVINENDTVATEEIRFGDNDTLAALVTNLIEAELLIILTDVDGLMDKDPNTHRDARLIEIAQAGDVGLAGFASQTVGVLGRGGMVTKLTAARLAARSGAHTVIANGLTTSIVTKVCAGESVGTLLTAALTPMTARKRWIAGHLRPKGELVVDNGAVNALRQQGVSLLAVGVVGVRGEFRRGDVVKIVAADGVGVAQGLSNYDASDVRKLCGVKSEDFGQHLSHVGEPELVHRDNLVVL